MSNSAHCYSESRRKRIIKRDDRKCFFCGSKKDLTIAHIFVWKKDGGKPVDENGLTACRECHDKLDFCKGISKLEQYRMLRLAQMYLTFYYMKEITDEDVSVKNLKIRR